MARVDPKVNWCRACGQQSTIRLAECPNCKQKPNWSEECPTPSVPYLITHNDYCFLKAIRVNPECVDPLM